MLCELAVPDFGTGLRKPLSLEGMPRPPFPAGEKKEFLQLF